MSDLFRTAAAGSLALVFSASVGCSREAPELPPSGNSARGKQLQSVPSADAAAAMAPAMALEAEEKAADMPKMDASPRRARPKKPASPKGGEGGGARAGDDIDMAFGAAADAPTAEADQVAPTRSWFPETFLFAPRVVTNAQGEANVDVLVPDRLTTWRVLGLAHTRSGMQAGTLASLVSNLPVSVDIVVPPYLVAGDRVALPVQLVNTTAQALTRTVTAKATGGQMGQAINTLRVDAGDSATSTVWLEVPLPGDVVVEASVGADDSVRRTIEVETSGDPKRAEKSGTLAAKRTFELALEAGVLPGSAEISMQVFPGALAILRQELAAAPERTSIDDDGYLLALTGRARALAAQLKAPIDEATLVRLSRIATQRTARRALAPELFSAMSLAPGALLHGPETLTGRNGEHLAAFVARAQRPDGTFAGQDGWPLQRVIVATAAGLEVVRAAQHTDAGKRRAAAASLRARGAFERFAGQIDDPYTAAVVLGVGVLEGALKDELQQRVAGAVTTDGEQMRSLAVPDGVVRPDGSRPTTVEATARALLALKDHVPSAAALPDLGAFVLSAYRPGVGFGDGGTNRVALEAVALIFDDPLPEKVVVSLTVDGKTLGSDALQGARLHDVLTLGGAIAPASGKPLALVVEADPPVPGLSYLVAVDYAVPFPEPPAQGLALDVTLAALKVGTSAGVTLRATAPGGAAIVIEHGLPAGVDPVKPSLEALVSSGAIESFTIKEGAVELVVPGRGQGELFEATYQVVPTLAGTLHPRVAHAELRGQPGSRVHFPPRAWTIAR